MDRWKPFCATSGYKTKNRVLALESLYQEHSLADGATSYDQVEVLQAGRKKPFYQNPFSDDAVGGTAMRERNGSGSYFILMLASCCDT